MIGANYNWIYGIEGLPKMVSIFLQICHQDTKEIKGPEHNPVIMGFAKEANVEKIYTADEIAWCALLMVVIALRAGKKVLFTSWDRLRAYSFTQFGTKVKEPMLGDVCVFGRPGGYHVALYFGEDALCYHVGGGNQSDDTNIVRINKARLVEARRPEYNIAQPQSVKKIFLDNFGNLLAAGEKPKASKGGTVSHNEA